jgi:lysophospholipase L1-like esterase
MENRRDFLKKATASALAASTIYAAGAAIPKPAAPDGLTILMQGDSITDGGRNRGAYYANQGNGMGGGYVYQIVSQLLGAHPEKSFRFYNRGISGNKVYQLAARWEDDCIQLQPDVLSILIGVNDFWHTLSGNYDGTAETYENDLRALLSRTKEALPEVKLIIGEPFAVKGGTAITEAWYPVFDDYRSIAKEVAGDFKASFIPYQDIFDKALNEAPVSYWCPDGVHPSMAGSYLMKEAWITAFNQLW